MATQKRIRRNWPEVLEEFRASGLSVQEFCRQRGIAASLLYKWRRRLRSETGARDAGFVELVGPVSQDCSSGVRIELAAGMTVCLERGFDQDTLRAVLDTVGPGDRCPG